MQGCAEEGEEEAVGAAAVAVVGKRGGAGVGAGGRAVVGAAAGVGIESGAGAGVGLAIGSSRSRSSSRGRSWSRSSSSICLEAQMLQLVGMCGMQHACMRVGVGFLWVVSVHLYIACRPAWPCGCGNAAI